MAPSVFRQCVITRAVLPKAQLFRLVRLPSGSIVWDEKNVFPGRGMYVSRSTATVQALFSEKKKGLWKHALKQDISVSEKEEIWKKLQVALGQKI